MKAITLAYHDVFDDQPFKDEVGRAHPKRYSMDRAKFRQHLESIPQSLASSVTTTHRLDDGENRTPVFLTFDDGALGSFTCVADELERNNWRGHFFIVSTWIGKPGFMNARQIRELASRGHVIGSHSRSHPERMSKLAWPDLLTEWKESCSVLDDVLGKKVTVASVPNGYYSRAVGRSAAEAGVKILFNSAPTLAATIENGCLVLGRYSIKADDAPAMTGALTTERWQRSRQKLMWDLRQVAKVAGGPAYLAVRTLLLSRDKTKTRSCFDQGGGSKYGGA